jgi:hypothetical protein
VRSAIRVYLAAVCFLAAGLTLLFVVANIGYLTLKGLPGAMAVIALGGLLIYLGISALGRRPFG